MNFLAAKLPLAFVATNICNCKRTDVITIIIIIIIAIMQE